MFNLAIITGSWIIKLATGPLVQSILKILIDILTKYAKEVIPLILDEIKKAAEDPNLKAEQKFEAVFNFVKATFPDVSTSIIRVLIEVCYTFLKSGSESK